MYTKFYELSENNIYVSLTYLSKLTYHQLLLCYFLHYKQNWPLIPPRVTTY